MNCARTCAITAWRRTPPASWKRSAGRRWMSRFDAVLFDCDGVLVDSETITNGVLRDMLEERGWKGLSAAECMRTFIGKTLRDERQLIEARTGQAMTEE